MTTPGTTSLWRNHVLPFTLWVTLLGVATVVGDYLLHRLDLVWVGRYLGIPGTLLILGALGYSLRKRKVILAGNVRSWLSMHEIGTWLGSWMVLLHAGVHFNAILPWLATIAMGVNVISGMVGKMLLGRSREHVRARREHYQSSGLSGAEVEQAVFWESVTIDAMTQWRKVHIPIFIVFVVLATGHIVSIFLFWGWR
jgi:hypothetical protein